MKLGEKIYKYRTALGMSQSELADRLEVSRQSVSKWELDSSVPELDKLIKMCELFGITLDELVNSGERSGEQTAAAPTHIREQRVSKPPHSTAGVILLCTAAVIFILLIFLSDPLTALFFSLPFAACGVCCLFMRRHVGFTCLWIVWTAVYLYFRMATSVTTLPALIRMAIYSVKMNNPAAVVITFLLATAEVCMIIYSIWYFRHRRVQIGKKEIILSCLGVAWIIAASTLPLLVNSGKFTPELAAAYVFSTVIVDRICLAIELVLLITYCPVIFEKIRLRRQRKI